MCGVAGLIGSGNSEALVRKMIGTIAHRGPDGSGVWVDKTNVGNGVILGHRRLSILDLTEAGAQPMADSTGQFVITYNGEIYNYLEVKAELVKTGVVFRSHSDTEVILEAYKRWGTACLDRFNGMFAFALYDKPRGKLFCSRDRYGEKPFLFSFGKGLFAFASEYKALLQHPDIPLDYDEWRLIRAAHNPSTGLDADRQTVFNAVQQLLPGEAMEVDVHSLEHRIWRYWQIKPGELREGADEKEVFGEFRELLTDSVRLRMRSDVPVGSCLSGGLDSSAIVCIARRLLGDDAPYNTFTGSFPGTSADEWHYAKQIVDTTGVISHVVEPTVDRFMEDLPEFIWHNELPVSSSSQFAQWGVFRLAKQRGITVLLDGQGADEGLGGYEQIFAHYVKALQERGETERLHRELPQIRERYPLALNPPARAMRDRLPFRFRHWLSNRFNLGSSLLYGLQPGVASRIGHENMLTRKSGFNALTSSLEQESFGRGLTTLLRYGDRNSMAFSREVRLPFCDHRIAEFVFSLPPHMLMGEVQTKRLLRESMKDVLPEKIRTRWNKQGFRPPQDLWFQSDSFLQMVRETLNTENFRKGEYWLPGWWEGALSRVQQGQLHLGWAIWQPVMIEMWQEHFVSRISDQRKNFLRNGLQT